jgi:Cell Wall Hydrolase
MTSEEIRAALGDREALALTAWAEARRIPRDDDSHSPIEELVAVMVVCRNRRQNFSRWRAADASYKAICLAPKQFSCWNEGTDGNHVALMILAQQLLEWTPGRPALDAELRECLHLADGVMGGAIIDRTGIANSYFAPAAMQPVGAVPAWAKGKPAEKIGDQLFLTL